MTRSVYVVGLDPAAGKSLVALGVAELHSRRAGRLAVFRPLAQASDPLIDLSRGATVRDIVNTAIQAAQS